jgi:hypothetical protein
MAMSGAVKYELKGLLERVNTCLARSRYRSILSAGSPRTEIVLLCGFDFKSRCAYIWGILKQYSPIADEVFQERYAGKL